MFTVYVLYSISADKFYVGFTSDLNKRIISHNFLGKGWTKRYRPWQIVYTKDFDSKKQAMLHERWLKSGVGREFLKKLKHSI
jgi:putative endonuclease